MPRNVLRGSGFIVMVSSDVGDTRRVEEIFGGWRDGYSTASLLYKLRPVSMTMGMQKMK
jgi:hypothetical protein